jgi:hypothetical protein
MESRKPFRRAREMRRPDERVHASVIQVQLPNQVLNRATRDAPGLRGRLNIPAW